MGIDLGQPATKGDVKLSFDALSAAQLELKSEIADTRRTLALEIIKTQADVREIKEAMATKDDVGRIMSAIDAFAGKSQNHDRAATLHGRAITDMRIEVTDHERRIKKLESR